MNNLVTAIEDIVYRKHEREDQDECDDDGIDIRSSFSGSDSYSFKLLTNDCIKLPEGEKE